MVIVVAIGIELSGDCGLIEIEDACCALIKKNPATTPPTTKKAKDINPKKGTTLLHLPRSRSR